MLGHAAGSSCLLRLLILARAVDAAHAASACSFLLMLFMLLMLLLLLLVVTMLLMLMLLQVLLLMLVSLVDNDATGWLGPAGSDSREKREPTTNANQRQPAPTSCPPRLLARSRSAPLLQPLQLQQAQTLHVARSC